VIAFDQILNMCVAGARDHVALPMARDGTIFHFWRSLLDRYCVYDLPARLAGPGCGSTTSHHAR